MWELCFNKKLDHQPKYCSEEKANLASWQMRRHSRELAQDMVMIWWFGLQQRMAIGAGGVCVQCEQPTASRQPSYWPNKENRATVLSTLMLWFAQGPPSPNVGSVMDILSSHPPLWASAICSSEDDQTQSWLLQPKLQGFRNVPQRVYWVASVSQFMWALYCTQPFLVIVSSLHVFGTSEEKSTLSLFLFTLSP